MFGLYEGLGFSCSLVPEEKCTTHYLYWPGDEHPQSYIHRDTYGAAYREDDYKGSKLDSEPAACSVILVVQRRSDMQPSWSCWLKAAWELNEHQVVPQYSVQQLWELGIHYAKRELWTQEDKFKGFAIGLKWQSDRWERHKHYEIGWCGQNASLANSLIAHYLATGDRDSLDKGLAALDAWASYARLPNGLLRCHFHHVLNQADKQEVLDACNIGTAAVQYFEAYRLAEQGGILKPVYLETAESICDFMLEQMDELGRIGKAWNADGICLDRNGTIGAFLIPALIEAYKHTGEERYLSGAVRSYHYYMGALRRDGYTTSGALDTHCIDKESAMPLLEAGIALFEATAIASYLQDAEYAAWYLSTWQWHHSIPFPEQSILRKLNYDSFGGTSVSTQHHHIDHYAVKYIPSLFKLYRITGNETWQCRAKAIWANATFGISDGGLVVNGKPRPRGSQDEGFYHTYWGYPAVFGVSEWLVAWPTAFRLETIRLLPANELSVLDNRLG